MPPQKKERSVLIPIILGITLILSAVSLVAVQNLYDNPNTGAHNHKSLTESQEDSIKSLINRAIDDHEFVYDDLLVSRHLLNTTIAELNDYDEIITTNIRDIKADINARFPQPNAQETGKSQTGTGTEALTITIHLDSDQFLQGDIIWISGTTTPLQQVEAIIKTPDDRTRTPNSPADKNGSYKIAMFTDLNTIKGDYTVYVKSGGDTSQTLKFNLE